MRACFGASFICSQGRIQEFFIAGWGNPNFGSERTVDLFYGKFFSHRDDHVFPNLWTPVAFGAGNTALRAEANRSLEGTQKQLHFWISLEFSLLAEYNARFIKLKSDIRSCGCKNFGLIQASGLIGASRDPPDGPSPWIRHSVPEVI